ncbi:type II secretion system F family protein [Mycolicibacterium sp.]|uniref:type II secretion system F family protein n=1 Tax=Mycolicibacterium sp. TaxID=2320850 RepID=UPI001A210C4B|nr:type II secretion system F family protein [Mycolicibacterium sp.]MBJ7399972.1 type II secretion system F family protein [Mycolicibacterium sp.]
MSATVTAAALLAAALLTTPPQRRRVAAATSRRRIGRIPVWPAVFLGAIATVMASPAAAFAIGLVAAVIGRRRRRRIRGRQQYSEGQAMAAALEVLVGELRIGAHPLRAFTVAAAESAGDVGASLRAVATRAELGADVAAGLRSAAGRSSVPAYWDRLAVCWQLAAEHGLPMSSLMHTAHRDIVGRQRFAGRVQAGLAGARATAAILAGLPFLGVALGEVIGARPVQFLLGGGGGWLLVVGVGLVGVGATWSDHIIDRLTL